MMRVMAFLLVVLMATPLAAVGVDEQVLPPAQEAMAREIMKDLRCLVCQNQSIEDSNAELARDLRMIVRERIAAGDDERAVKAYLQARYGEWILMQPPFNLRMLALWATPFLALLVGAVVLLRRRRLQAAAPAPLTAEEEARLQAILRDKDQTS